MTVQSIDEQLSQLARRSERIISDTDLKAKLLRSQQTGKPLRIKLGMDPTAPDVTLGHAVPLRIVRQFQEWGHKAVLIIGDYTARIGDPSGRSKTRPSLSADEIDRNAKTYEAQVTKIILSDPEHLEVRYNGEWLANMSLADIIKLTSRGTVAQILTREDFAKRFEQHKEIRLHEILYPMMQGWDSVQVHADLELGGSDQLFNNLIGRQLQQEDHPDDPLAGQVVIVTPLLVGTDGVAKMSKSLGNYIALTDPPSGDGGMFGKIMSLPDQLMESYFTLLTDLPESEYKALITSSPRDAKIKLAKWIITWLHNSKDAEAAEAAFVKQFVNKDVPDEMPQFSVGAGPHKIGPLLVTAKLAASNGEAIRKVKEGAVYLNGEKFTDFQKEISVEKETVVKLGRKYARLVP